MAQPTAQQLLDDGVRVRATLLYSLEYHHDVEVGDPKELLLEILSSETDTSLYELIDVVTVDDNAVIIHDCPNCGGHSPEGT